MWRTIIQGAHLEHAEKYFTESYIQHNPNVASGRDALVTYMKNSRPRRDIQPNITFPVISIMAEGDLVMLATVSYDDDPTKPGEKYAGTHFDLFRIENGKIAEHWDSVAKDPKALKYDPNTQNEKRKAREKPRGNRPRRFFACLTTSTPMAIAASRWVRPSVRARSITRWNERSSAWCSRSMTSFSVQKNHCRSCTHSK